MFIINVLESTLGQTDERTKYPKREKLRFKQGHNLSIYNPQTITICLQ